MIICQVEICIWMLRFRILLAVFFQSSYFNNHMLIFAMYVGNTFLNVLYVLFWIVYNCVAVFVMKKCNLHKILNAGSRALL